MATAKLKTNSSADNYGSLKTQPDVREELKQSVFNGSHSKGKYEKLPDENSQTQADASLFSMFRYADCLDKLVLVIGVIVAVAQGVIMAYTYVLTAQVLTTIIHVLHRSLIAQSTESQNNPDHHTDLHWKQIRLFVYISISSFICGYLKAICFTFSAERQIARIRTLLYRIIITKPISYYDAHSSSEITSMLSRYVDTMAEGLGIKLALHIMTMSSLISGIIFSMISEWRTSLVMLCLVPTLYIIGAVVEKHKSRLVSSELAAYSTADGVVQETISSIRTVFAFNGQNTQIKRYTDAIETTHEFGLKKARISGLQTALSSLFTYIFYGICALFSAFLVNNGTSTAGRVIVAFFTAGRTSFHAIMILPQFHTLHEAKGAAQHLMQFIDSSEAETSIQRKTAIYPVKKILFENVSFTYPMRPDVLVLNGVSFQVNPGEIVAIVGSSGSGKSTCIQLLLRFYDPTDGLIRVNDDRSIDEMDVEHYRQQIAVVSQEPVLFATSIRENIQYGNDNASFADIENAARQAHIHDFIMSLPNKYETIVGQRGAQLSGGEKQRICLARAFVRSASILLLDEPTSALDNHSEAIIHQAVIQTCRSRQQTALIVTHRLSTIQYVDRIIVMKQGMVIEQGTHDELLANKEGVYSKMVSQYGKDIDNEEQDVLSANDNIELSTTNDKASLQREYEQDSVKDEGEIQGKRLSTTTAAWNLSRSAWRWLLYGCIASAVMSLRTVSWCYLLGKLIMGLGALTNVARWSSVINVSISFLILGIVTCLSSWLSFYFFGRASALLIKRLRRDTLIAILQQEISWFDRKKNGPAYLSKLLETDAATIQTAIATIMNTLVEVIVTVASNMIVSSILLPWEYTTTQIVLTIIFTIICWYHFKFAKWISGQRRHTFEDLNVMAVETTQNIRTVFELNRQKLFNERYTKLVDESKKIPFKYIHVTGLFCAIEMARASFAMPVILLVIIYIKNEHKWTLLQPYLMITFGSFANQVYILLYAALPKLGASLAAAQYFTQLLQRKPQTDLQDGTSHPSPLEIDKIEFDHVRFSYPLRPKVNILNDLSFTLNSGQSIALVGTTGCGKSTVLALIERFYDATSGKVCVNSTDIRQVELRSLRTSIAYVGQEPVLFNMSIRDNIAFGNDHNALTMDDIIKAATDANIHSFIQKLPRGYDTSVGQFGHQISGGERQRLAIARALARKPTLLLLDEPTSALDVENERIIEEIFQRKTENLTIVTVAHQLSTIRHVDVIYVMEHGQIVERGSHQELLSKPNGIYAKFYNRSQSSGGV